MLDTVYNIDNVENNDMNILYNSINATGTNPNAELEKIINTLKLDIRLWLHNNKTYQIIRYNKQYLTNDRISTSGLFRSVIFKEGKIIVFSPPKGIHFEYFIENYNPKNCIAQEFIEGTMINLFFDNEQNEWEISTRSSIGGRMSYFTSSENNKENTFRYMFLETCNNINLNFDNLSKEYCYSFVLQHPNNRIVIPFTETKLYLVAVYNINNETKIVTSLSIKNNIKSLFHDSDISYPENYDFDNYNELKEKWAGGNTDYKIVGIVLYHPESGMRTKLRNPNYEFVRHLRGNQPKLQYRYLVLRQQQQVSEYLKYYPEANKDISLFRDQIHIFTHQLHKNYISCFILKKQKLGLFPYQYRTHMYNLHNLYIKNLRPKQKNISKDVVINYINTMPPAKLMYSLNYHLREQNNN